MWHARAKMLVFPGFGGLTEVFGRMSAGTSGRKLPLWADFSFLNSFKRLKIGDLPLQRSLSYQLQESHFRSHRLPARFLNSTRAATDVVPFSGDFFCSLQDVPSCTES